MAEYVVTPIQEAPSGTAGIRKLARQHLSRWAEHLLADNGEEEGLERLRTLATSLAGNPELQRNIAFLIRDFCAERMRPEIKRFAGLMEMKLMKHDPARGESWKEGDREHHIERVEEIAKELVAAVRSNRQVGLKAADLANHAMMLADLAGELKGM